MIIVTSLFSKSTVGKRFPFTRKRNAGVFKFLLCEERFQKRCEGLVWTVGLTVEIKLRCQISSGVVWTLHKKLHCSITVIGFNTGL